MAASMEGDTQSVDRPVLETLLLPDRPGSGSNQSEMPKTCLPCILCGETYEHASSGGAKEEYLKHLLEAHRLVISHVNLIANFKSYVLYWKHRFKEQTLTDLCSTVQTSETEKSDDGSYYLLSDVLPEDKQLRDFLQKRKLEHVLQSQQEEREDSGFSRGCLFCKEHFTGNRVEPKRTASAGAASPGSTRSQMFNHMAIDHNFNVGQPDNIVFANEFLDVLEEKLNSLQCLYCEKTFRDRTTLKEHMRKKQHRKINCQNKMYDRFYIINYLELGKNWEKIHGERDFVDLDSEDTETEDEWSGWEEDKAGRAVCLFCEFSGSGPADKLQLHMQELHDFDLAEVKLRLGLNFYQQVKLVNYIRRQVHLGVCIGCQGKFEDRSSLLEHMHQASHTNVIPELTVWDQPQYFFPTYENDTLLCQIEDQDDNCGSEMVIAEDTPSIDTSTILAQESLRKELLKS